MLKADKWLRYLYGREIMSNAVLPAFEKAEIPDLKRMKYCGHVVNVIGCKACLSQHFAGFWRCLNRWCINCNHVKVLAWLARLVPVVKEWKEQGKYVSVLNFTIKDTLALKDGLNLLENSFRDMYNDKKMRKIWKNRFPGGIRSLEVKIGKNSERWHPHLHCLVLQDSYNKDFEWLRDEWQRITKNNSFGVYEDNPEKIGSVWIKEIKSVDSVLNGVVETLKYIMKPETELYKDSELLMEAWSELKGKRQINTWGILRGLSKQVDEDIEHTEIKKLTEFVCQNCGCTEGELNSIVYDLVKDNVLFDI